MKNPADAPDEMLRAAALSMLDRGAPEVAARLRTDPAFARAVEELERARGTAERVLGEGARATEEAVRSAGAADQARVLRTLEDLARPGRRSRRRAFLWIGLVAAGLLGFLLLRSREVKTDVWMGTRGTFEYVPTSEGPGSFRWHLELLPGESLQLSFFALRDDARSELLLGPLELDRGSSAWQATDDQARLLKGDWQAELELQSAGEKTLVGRARRFSSH